VKQQRSKKTFNYFDEFRITGETVAEITSIFSANDCTAEERVFSIFLNLAGFGKTMLITLSFRGYTLSQPVYFAIFTLLNSQNLKI
jgi:hypothetical protein